MLDQLQQSVPEQGHVVELGIGPGYLANHILNAMPSIRYCGIDFSQPMLTIAKERLGKHGSRISYIVADLVNDDWGRLIDGPVSAIVSTWSLHDLGSPKKIGIVYGKSARALNHAGILLNGDFIKPAGTTLEFEGGRFEIEKHLDLLKTTGFIDVECLAIYEQELISPTSAQNYACFRAQAAAPR
jgi:SAM-dependent methyltransferase